jgi:hypothetical protein
LPGAFDAGDAGADFSKVFLRASTAEVGGVGEVILAGRPGFTFGTILGSATVSATITGFAATSGGGDLIFSSPEAGVEIFSTGSGTTLRSTVGDGLDTVLVSALCVSAGDEFDTAFVKKLRSTTGVGLETLFKTSRPNGEFLPSLSNGLDISFVGDAALCCLALLISAIHEGCAGGAWLVTFDFSSLPNADSSQLDFVGLHLFEGLVGSAPACSSCTLRRDAMDFARLCARVGIAGLTKPSSSFSCGLSLGFWVMVRLLWLDVGREPGSSEFSLLDDRVEEARSAV